jgi:ABC-type cobalamin transport system ATPase subunit
MLKKGSVLISGEKAQVMTSKNMSETFEAKIRLKERGGLYSMSFE